jgi:hypothetical protein
VEWSTGIVIGALPKIQGAIYMRVKLLEITTKFKNTSFEYLIKVVGLFCLKLMTLKTVFFHE